MFGMGSARVRAGMVATALVATAALTVVVVQASASGTQRAKLGAVPKQSSLKQAADAAQASLRSDAGPQASAIVAGSPAPVTCGETLTASTTLTANLDCSGSNGLIIGASGVTLNLDGYTIAGNEVGTGVVGLDSKDTIESGYIEGFVEGIEAVGSNDVVTKVQVNHTAGLGLDLAGADDIATGDTLAENDRDGLYSDSTGGVLQSVHALNNGGVGITALGAAKVLDNIADGNAGSGISASSGPATLTGNKADYNGALGIDGESPVIDGGSNTAVGNGTKEQCRGVVCS